MLPSFEPTDRVINGSRVHRRRIGTYHHRHPEKVFAQSQEVAAWHRHGTFPAGDYPVYEYLGGFTPGQSYVSVSLEGGVITSASFPSLFGGVAYGKDRGPEEVGQPFNHSFEITSWRIGQYIAGTGEEPIYTFVEGIEVREFGQYRDGSPMLRVFDPQTNKPIGR